MKFEIIGKIADSVSSLAGRTGLKIDKYAPELLFGAGIVFVAAGTVMACKATLRADEVLDEHNDKIDTINETKDMADKKEAVYTDNEYKRDIAVTWTQTLVGFGKLYGPAIGVTIVGIGCFAWSHRILSGRIVGLAAAYNVLGSQFSNYRANARERFGDEVDRQLRYGIKEQEVKVVEKDEDGKEVEGTATTPTGIDLNEASDYARYFDESNPNWDGDPERVMLFLKTQQRYANDLLNARGHLFLNEVYDLLDFPRTKAGAVVGWVKGNGDDYVDFCIFTASDPNKRAFVNGLTSSVLIDFNVDGVIYDLI